MATDTIVLQVFFRVRPGSEAAFEEALANLVDATRPEPGCLRFDPFVAAEAPGTFLLHEEWATRADLDRHSGMPHVSAFKARFGELLAAAPEVAGWRRMD